MPAASESSLGRVLLTGGTGFVGLEVARALSAAGYTFRVLARNPKSPAAQTAAGLGGAALCEGDVTDARSLPRAMDGVQTVIHLVGIIREARQITFELLHTKATRNVVEAARQAGVRRFIHMSALGTRANAVSRYHQTKWAAEEAVRGSGLDFTIFRPSLIYGPGDQFVNLFARMARISPVLPVMGSGRARFQPVAVETVAAAFVRALAEPKAIGRTFDLCGPDALTLPQILDEILAASGRRRWTLRIPLPLACVQATLLEFLYGKILGKPPPLNRDQLVMLEEETVGDRKPAVELFGLEEIAFGAGIRAYVISKT
jgi:NADH dehydrogenase